MHLDVNVSFCTTASKRFPSQYPLKSFFIYQKLINQVAKSLPHSFKKSLQHSKPTIELEKNAAIMKECFFDWFK